MMRKFLLAAWFALISSGCAHAQSTAQPVLPGLLLTTGCQPGQTACFNPYSDTNPLPVSGTFSATLAGFTPNGSYATPLSVSTSSSRVALPTGTVVLVQNVGSNVAYVNFGNGSVTATTSQIAVPALGGCTLTVGANVDIAAITASSTTTLNIVGGAGLGNTCYGGGAGGGGSGGDVNVTQWGGAATTLGQKDMDHSVPFVFASNQSILSTSLDAVDGAPLSLGQGTSSTSLPVVIASDQDNLGVVIYDPATGMPVDYSDPTVVVGAGTAGTADSHPVTVQGIASMTPVQVSQATAANLNATVAQGTATNLKTQAVSDGTVTPGTAASTSFLQGCIYNSSLPGPTTGQGLATQCDAKGNARNVFMDAAGNARGANVDSSNNLNVVPTSSGATGSIVPASASYMGVQTDSGVASNSLTGVVGCNKSVVYDASTNGSTELVALSGSKVIYVCGYTIFSAGTVNVSLKTGHGTACATSGANITPAFQLTAQTGAVDGATFYRGLKTVAGDALCLLTSGGVAVQGIVYYTQF